MPQADETNNAPFTAHKGTPVSGANQNGGGYKCHPTVLLLVMRTNEKDDTVERVSKNTEGASPFLLAQERKQGFATFLSLLQMAG